MNTREFEITFDSEKFGELEVTCETEIHYEGPSGSYIEDVTVKYMYDENNELWSLGSLPDLERRALLKKATDKAEALVYNWAEDIEADLGDRAYDAWKDDNL